MMSLLPGLRSCVAALGTLLLTVGITRAEGGGQLAKFFAGVVLNHAYLAGSSPDVPEFASNAVRVKLVLSE